LGRGFSCRDVRSSTLVFRVGRVWLALNHLPDFEACRLQKATNFLRLEIEKSRDTGCSHNSVRLDCSSWRFWTELPSPVLADILLVILRRNCGNERSGGLFYYSSPIADQGIFRCHGCLERIQHFYVCQRCGGRSRSALLSNGNHRAPLHMIRVLRHPTQCWG
jgi:hypothetical protein